MNHTHYILWGVANYIVASWPGNCSNNVLPWIVVWGCPSTSKCTRATWVRMQTFHASVAACSLFMSCSSIPFANMVDPVIIAIPLAVSKPSWIHRSDSLGPRGMVGRICFVVHQTLCLCRLTCTMAAKGSLGPHLPRQQQIPLGVLFLCYWLWLGAFQYNGNSLPVAICIWCVSGSCFLWNIIDNGTLRDC